MDVDTIKKAVQAHKNHIRAKQSQYYFKTGPGEYGEGDIFIGLTTPIIRKLAKQFQQARLPTIKHFLYSPIHEERLLALIILLYQYPQKTNAKQQEIFDFYITHLDQVNNWDLIDVTAPGVVGRHLYHHPDTLSLPSLAASENMWHRRVAMLAAFYFIKQQSYALPIAIAKQLRNDKEDLIHKVVGWMLREIGKRDLTVTKDFLNQYGATLPRTMLRYAIERFTPAERQYYMQLKKSTPIPKRNA